MRDHRVLAFLGVLVLVATACAPAAQAPTSTTTGLPPMATPPGGTTPPPATPTPTPRPTAAPTAAPTAGPRYGGMLTNRIRADIRLWDPQQNKEGDLDGRKQHNLVFSLPAVQPSTPDVATCQATLKPDAAESWKWTDSKTLEVKLRQGIRFHNKPPVNGREVTADDLAFSLNRALFKEPIQGVETLVPRVTGIETVDRYTVRISTDGPLPVLPQSLLGNDKGSVILAKESAGPTGTWSDPEKSYIGSGPFIFKQWQPGVKVAYERNPNYWKKGLPYLDRAEFLLIVDESTALAAMAAGKLDTWSEEMSGMLAAPLKKVAPQIQLQKCPVWGGYGPIELQLKEPPFNDVRVRRALSMALDRQAFLDTVLVGEGIDAPYGPAGLSEWYLATKDYPPEIRKYLEYNPTEARRLLAEAGYPQGLKGIELNVSSRYGALYREMAELLVASLPKAGFDIKPNWLQHNVWMARRDAQDWHGLLWRRGPFTDPYRHMTKLYSKNSVDLNYNRTNDPVLDALIDKFLRTVDAAEAMELAKQIQYRVADQAWIVAIPQPLDYSAFQPWVHGFNRAGYTAYTSTWLEMVWTTK